jgi:5-formyltetrahydrofolate cyclo-ligase
VSKTLNKQALRRELRARRAALSPVERIGAAQGLATQLAALPETLTDERVAGYWATGGELSLHVVLARLLARGATYHLPIVPEQAGPLSFARWRTGDGVAPNRFGIPEPAASAPHIAPDALELVFVPLLAFDRGGHRLGMGAGYYDRTFAFLATGERPREPLLVGVAYAFQEIERVEHEPHDVRLDFIATERELIDCSSDAR